MTVALPARRGSRIALWIGTWTIAAFVLWLAGRGVDWRSALAAIGSAAAGWVTVATVLNFGILLLWAQLWRGVLPRECHVPYLRMFEIASVTSAIMNIIPALVGHASAIALLVRRGGVPVRTAGAVLTLDQVGEGLSKLAVLAIAVVVMDLPPWMTQAALTIVVLVALLVGAVTAVGRFGHLAGGTRIGRLLGGIREDLQIVRSPARVAGAIAIAMAMKAAEAGAIAAVIFALGIDVPASGAFVVLGAVNLATMLPVAPGNVGTYEAGAVAAYRWMGVPADLALAAAIVQHACFLLPAVGTGVAWLAVTGTGAARAAVRPLARGGA